MRQIKFRACNPHTGKTHYGYVKNYHEGLFGRWWMEEPCGENFRLYPVENVAQLVEVIDGVEVYEGDIVERDGKKYVATLEAAYREAD